MKLLIIILLLMISIKLIEEYRNFNRLRSRYLRQFEYYLNNGIVNESYCHNFIDRFSKMNLKMFWKYLFGARKLEELIDNPRLCRNFRASLRKNKPSKYIENANAIWEHWFQEIRSKR